MGRPVKRQRAAPRKLTTAARARRGNGAAAVVAQQAALSFAVPDWERRLFAGESLLPDLPLNARMAAKGVRAFNMLRLADVVGTPTLEHAGAEWFRDIVRVVFGSYDPATKARFLRELFVLVPKKNAKTTQGALIMLLLLLFNERPRANSIMTAPVKEVAQVAYNAIAGAIELDPVLAKKFHVREHMKTIMHRETKATLQIMTFDPEVLTGQKLFAALIDELHVVARSVKTASSLRQIRGGMLPYREALLMFITTQSESAPAGAFKAELDAARAVRDGKNKSTTSLPILYEFPRAFQQDVSQPWRDSKHWAAVTPNLGKSIELSGLRALLADAEAKGEEELRSWASQHLNIEIGLALRSDSWAGAPLWERATDVRAASLQSLLSACDVVDAGIDGGGLDDLLSLTFAGRARTDGAWLVWSHSWANKILLQRRKQEYGRYKDFVDVGDLTLVDAGGEDVRQCVQFVVEARKVLDKIGLDPYGVGTIVTALVAEGFERDKDIVGIPQGWRLSGIIKTAERALNDGMLKHGGQELMAWAVGNAKSEPRGNAMLITKAASGAGKIDPLMAMFNALQLLALNPPPKEKAYQLLIVSNAARAASAQQQQQQQQRGRPPGIAQPAPAADHAWRR